MNHRPLARVLAVVVLGIALAVGARSVQTGTRARGKEAFVAAQARRFDQVIAGQSTFPGICMMSIVSVGVAIGVYEALAGAIRLAIRPRAERRAA